MIRVVLPHHLRTLARVGGEVEIEIGGPATRGALLDAIEDRYPMLRGTIRDHVTRKRRPFVRFFACGEDLSHEPPEAPLPDAVASGAEPFLVVQKLWRDQQKQLAEVSTVSMPSGSVTLFDTVLPRRALWLLGAYRELLVA